MNVCKIKVEANDAKEAASARTSGHQSKPVREYYA